MFEKLVASCYTSQASAVTAYRVRLIPVYFIFRCQASWIRWVYVY